MIQASTAFGSLNDSQDQAGTWPRDDALALLPETPLASLLQLDGVSARLARMLVETELGKMGLRAYVSDRQRVEVWMLRTRNCGTRSVSELRALVFAHVQYILANAGLGTSEAHDVGKTLLTASQASETPAASDDSAGTWPRESALALLPETPLGTLLQPDGLSARLDRMLRETELSETGLRTYVSDRERIDAWMLRTPNCGRRSVSELKASVCAHVFHILAAAGLSEQEARAAAEVLLSATARVEPRIEGPPDDLDLEEFIDWHLSRMKPRSREILTRRFGLNGAAKQTLEEIGTDLSVTRERVRQVEAKEIKRIRQLCARFPLTPYLDEERARLAGDLFGEGIHVRYADVDALSHRLDGHLDLAVEAAGHRPLAWLTSTAHETRFGFLRHDANLELFRACADTLAQRSVVTPMPRSLAALTAGLEPRHATAAVETELGWHVAHSYVFRRRPGRRALRTAMLHAILSCTGRPSGVADLLARYHEAAPSDLCSDRDLIIVMEGAPHLFLEIEEACWAALGPCGEPPAPVGRDIEPTPLPDEEDIDDGTVASALERALRERGPTRVGTLIDEAIDILPAGRSPRSVGPTLLMNPSRFVRALPGVWALWEQIPEEHELAVADHVDYLLNPAQARTYALARHAGEPWRVYPLWTPTAEMRLCRWARRHGDPELLSSLLAVATIDSWPTVPEDKAEWSDTKDQNARFELCFEPRQTYFALMPDRVLALALALKDHGTLGWITVNRVLRYQACAHVAAKVLETLCRMGVALAPAGPHAWQRPHRAGPKLTEWIDRLTDVIHRTGTADWQHEDLRAFAGEFTGTDTESTSEGAVEEMDELESLMADHRRAMQMRRLREQLEEAER